MVARCIYGVDKNPLAVELCRVALWLEGHAEGWPLTFLDHRIKCGDSLVGVLDLAVLEAGLPDEAFEPVGGDDRKLAAGLKKHNRQERSSQLYVFNAGDALDLAPLAAAAARLAAIPDDTPANVRRKQAAYDALLNDPRRKRLKDACDLWTAAFFQRMANGEGRMANDGRSLFITSEAVNRALAGDLGNPQLVARAQAVADAQRFFHWPLEFPEVFERHSEWGMGGGEWRVATPSPFAASGFDVVLGNPPWEMVQHDPEEFFAAREPAIAAAPNMSVRMKMIERLRDTNPALYEEFRRLQHLNDCYKKFLHASERFVLTSRGRINMAYVFAELGLMLVSKSGRAGLLVPTGIMTDSFAQRFSSSVVENGQLINLFDFENREKLFPDVDSRMKFCLLTLGGGRTANGEASPATFAFFAARAEHLRDPRRVFSLTAAEIARINPNTRTLPVFRTRQDAVLTGAIYQRVPVLVNEHTGKNPWNVSFKLMYVSSDLREPEQVTLPADTRSRHTTYELALLSMVL